ncbi:hypothetical protein BgiMline_001020 [Biomphalaria glabrata]|nr:hypothetical protein BgiMline_000946 [Biomphalaria glabrata]KAI8789155.1 hypothetical protein BgiBS90_009413 [Biomphalaria glabrata]
MDIKLDYRYYISSILAALSLEMNQKCSVFHMLKPVRRQTSNAELITWAVISVRTQAGQETPGADTKESQFQRKLIRSSLTPDTLEANDISGAS